MTYVGSFEREKSFWRLLQDAENKLLSEIDPDAFVSTCRLVSLRLSSQCLRARISLCLSHPSNTVNFLE